MMINKLMNISAVNWFIYIRIEKFVNCDPVSRDLRNNHN